VTPAVSAVIATYNQARFLPAALDSVLGQTLTDLEVIVVDDGSTDETPQVLARYRSDPRIRVERIVNSGPAAARNHGWRRARAPLVAFLDSDDVWLPEKLERQRERFAANSALAVVYARRLLLDGAGRERPYDHPPLFRGAVLPQLFLTNFICLSSAVVRREALEQSGGFDERIKSASCEDYDLWLHLARDHPFDYVDEALVLYRTDGQPAPSRSEARLRTALTVMRRFLNEGGGRERLDRRLVRRAWAETYAHLGLFLRERSRLAALGSYGRSLTFAPNYALAWKGLASMLLPETVRCWARSSLRRLRSAW
jgi:glycosyltransferase involved in cell wall biosynthesis